MCGIAGVFCRELRQVNAEKLRALVGRMIRLLAHRGPDGEGIEQCEHVFLGHRRLAILDLENGAQPMWSACGRYLIAFNGEIFNYLELRAELIACGMSFRTESDTEVLLAAFKYYGQKAFGKLNGQFACAIYDRASSELTLARDPLGEKPLYYTQVAGELAFASELKSLLEYIRSRAVSPELDLSALNNYLALNYVPFGRTLVRGIHSVSAGCALTVSLDGRIESQSYYDLPGGIGAQPANQKPGSLSDVLDRAVKLRLRSDVPLGVFLSGGVDSALITALATHHGQSLVAFVADFADERFSEVGRAQFVADRLGLELERVRIEPERQDLPALIEKLVWHADTPLADSSGLPLYLLSQVAARRIKVALCGDGGDELFGGYLTYRATNFSSAVPRLLKSCAPFLASCAGLLIASENKVGWQERAVRFLRNIDLPPAQAHFAWNGMFRMAEKLRLVHPDLQKTLAVEETFGLMADRYIGTPEAPSLSELRRADCLSYLESDILVKSDRMSLAHGLELRPPFMDRSVINYAFSLKDHDLIKRGLGKLPLRDLARKLIPGFEYAQAKQGFSIPVHRWFRTCLREFIEDLISSRDTRECGIFNQAELVRIWKDHQ
ncbi:MAG: asparagine synthase (glutamine-hydrolyzing), partial [Bdellovibrionales bacterium]|nr:asparagine synthase (glutamine-hydrolyzing) [Bdellovibrionales bacterium]